MLSRLDQSDARIFEEADRFVQETADWHVVRVKDGDQVSVREL